MDQLRFTSYAVSLVSDRSDWTDAAVELCREMEGLAEHWCWSAARGLANPGDALLIDLVNPFPARQPLFGEWASRAWQPISVVSLAPQPGAAGMAAWLGSLGYSRLLQPTARVPYWHELQSNLKTVLQSRARIVPLAAEALSCYDPPVIRALSEALLLIPERRTVNAWAIGLGLERRQQLEALFAARHLPRPKEVLEALRLARAVESALRSSHPPSREELARRFRYPSGDYLGKRAKQLTGLSLGQLFTVGVSGVLSCLRPGAQPRPA